MNYILILLGILIIIFLAGLFFLPFLLFDYLIYRLIKSRLNNNNYLQKNSEYFKKFFNPANVSINSTFSYDGILSKNIFANFNLFYWPAKLTNVISGDIQEGHITFFNYEVITNPGKLSGNFIYNICALDVNRLLPHIFIVSNEKTGVNFQIAQNQRRITQNENFNRMYSIYSAVDVGQFMIDTLLQNLVAATKQYNIELHGSRIYFYSNELVNEREFNEFANFIKINLSILISIANKISVSEQDKNQELIVSPLTTSVLSMNRLPSKHSESGRKQRSLIKLFFVTLVIEFIIFGTFLLLSIWLVNK